LLLETALSSFALIFDVLTALLANPAPLYPPAGYNANVPVPWIVALLYLFLHSFDSLNIQRFSASCSLVDNGLHFEMRL